MRLKVSSCPSMTHIFDSKKDMLEHLVLCTYKLFHKSGVKMQNVESNFTLKPLLSFLNIYSSISSREYLLTRLGWHEKLCQ